MTPLLDAPRCECGLGVRQVVLGHVLPCANPTCQRGHDSKKPPRLLVWDMPDFTVVCYRMSRMLQVRGVLHWWQEVGA